MEIKSLTFLFKAYWDISPKMAPCNLCVGTETVYFGITEYAQFRFPVIYYRLDMAMALTRLKYHISFLMDYSELCYWHWCSSEGDCERCSLWDSWWRTLIPKLSNTLGFRGCEKLMLLIDVCHNHPSESIHFFMAWQPNILTNSLLINWICSLFAHSFFTSMCKFPSGW